MSKEFKKETLAAFEEIRQCFGPDAVLMISRCTSEPAAEPQRKTRVKDGPHEMKEEIRDGQLFVMFDPRVMAAFRLGSKIIWWRMQEHGTHWSDARLGDGLRFDLCRPRGNLMCWCFLPYSDSRYYFMGEIPEGQGDMERLHGKNIKGRKAY